MSVNYIEVLNPTGEVEKKEITTSAIVGDLNGKVLGIIDNGKPNYDIFLARLMELLSQRYDFSGVIQVKKVEKDTGAPLNRDATAKLVAGCDVVLNGICD